MTPTVTTGTTGTTVTTGTTGTTLQRWQAWQRAGRRADSTIRLRLYHVARLERETQRPAAQLDTEDLVQWIAAHDWSTNTVRSYSSSLAAFYRWLVVTEQRADDPTLRLPHAPPQQGLPRPAPEDVLGSAVRAANPRVRLMLRLAASAGLRRCEIARVHTADVVQDLVDGWSLRVRGKGDKVRLVPLSRLLAAELRALPAGWVFPSPAGGHLTPAHVGKLMSRALGPGWAAHSLRHRFATQAYAIDRDLRAIQELLGHSKPETTAIYTLVPAGAKRRAVDAIPA